MATKQIWVNLPVKDVLKSRAFFTKIGFTFNARHSETDCTAQCMLVGEDNFVFMLFPEDTFKGFVGQNINDKSESSQMLFSIDAESREEVDALAEKVIEAGGTLFAEPAENQGWMYGFGFSDLDQHRWNVLYMDMSKLDH